MNTMRGVLILLPLLLMLLCSSWANSVDEEELKPMPLEYKECDQVTKVPPHEQCGFVKEICKEESRDASLSVNWLQMYYCNVAGKVLAQMLFWGIVLALSSILFMLLSDTADKFFGPTLTQISMDIPKMRPRFSGVTLLAFANGAPDLSATINAIKTCKFDLSLGALTGAGMFVNCFVAGYIIVVSGGARCRGATIRDVSAYAITILGLLVALLVGRLGLFAVICAFIVYAAFVVLVFIADEWHEKGRPNFWEGPMSRMTQSVGLGQTSSIELLPDAVQVWAPIDGNANDNLDLSQYPGGQTGLDSSLLPRPQDGASVWAYYTPSNYRQKALGVEIDDSEYQYNEELDPIADDLSNESHISRNSTSSNPIDAPHMATFETELPDLGAHHLISWNSLLSNYPWLLPLWKDLLMEDWSDMGVFLQILLVFRLPFVILQRATIPMTSSENYSKKWLVISMALSPFFTLYYFDSFSALGFLLATISGAVLGLMAQFCAQNETSPPRWSLGTSRPIGAAAVALYGLVMGVFWIDIIAGELVDLLHCVGVVLGIPGAIMGLTVLAWGNSIGDFFTNKSVAKAGRGNMALTACYAGPVFNMSMGLGLGFLSFLIAEKTHYASVKAEAQIVLGCIFLLLHGAAVIAIGLWRGMRLPKNFGYFSISLYGLYLIIAIALELKGNESGEDYSGQCKG